MEALLPLLCRTGLLWGSEEAADEATDALRRIVRLVWTSATRVGVMGRLASAVAAAAAESDGLDDSWRRKTAAAAVAAFGSTGAVARGCEENSMVSQVVMTRHEKGWWRQLGLSPCAAAMRGDEGHASKMG